MYADGSNPVRLTDTGGGESPAWSPDGTRIAFTSRGDSNGEIYVMEADGSNPGRCKVRNQKRVGARECATIVP